METICPWSKPENIISQDEFPFKTFLYLVLVAGRAQLYLIEAILHHPPFNGYIYIYLHIYDYIMGVSKIGVPQNGWFRMENRKTLLKWMIWGHPYFWKHPYVWIALLPVVMWYTSRQYTRLFQFTRFSKVFQIRLVR